MTAGQHPKGTNARVLLTAVFGPYAQDDEYGSRALNPMELYHNQVTRTQGVFSLRMFHRSWGILMIQHNIKAPSTVLDFPSQERFIEELKTHPYDIIGISSIIPNVGKVKRMCELIRYYQPQCTIVVGGHIANMTDVETRFDADHIVKGDGIAWFRRYLGQKEDEPITHPELLSGFGGRTMGVQLSRSPRHTAAVLIPSVGCPMGCNFCSTSAMFGGKGKFINFYETGQELFQIMEGMEHRMGVQSFFVMDENFLLHRKRALELLDLMKEHQKSWSLYVFSSGRVLRSYTMDQLLGLGISWVWMGLEGEDNEYHKLRGVDTLELVHDMQANGIRVLGSSIIGLETHTPENIDAVIDYAIKHDTDFHQFMLYTPVAGTPLYEEQRNLGTLYTDMDEADTHGQFMFNFRHPHISREQSGEILLQAFDRDFEVNGPSVLRIARTLLQGWQRHKNHPDLRIRRRIHRESEGLPAAYNSALWATEAYFRTSKPQLAKKAAALREEFNKEFGLQGKLVGPLGGAFLRYLMHREEKRLNNGWTYQPPLFVDRRNWEMLPQTQ